MNSVLDTNSDYYKKRYLQYSKHIMICLHQKGSAYFNQLRLHVPIYIIGLQNYTSFR